MKRIAKSNRVLGLVVTTALTGALLSGCTTADFGTASASGAAHSATGTRQQAAAIERAEAAVMASPSDAALRAALGSAYLDAGRFASAATSYDDAMQLGDTSPRTTLSLALALTGAGRQREAAALLIDNGSEIATADRGLALALAGQPDRGASILSDGIRGGENTAKMRQNLAFAFALAGRWREARLMAEQDLPANEVSNRIGQWAEMVDPAASQLRVASLLSVPTGVADAGQPVELALGAAPAPALLAFEASALAQAEPDELPAVAEAFEPAPAPVVAESAPYRAPEAALPSSFQVAFTEPAADDAPAGMVHDGIEFVSSPVVQSTPARAVQAAPVRVAQAAPVRTPALAASPRVRQGPDGTHLIQLGSFSSEQGARRAWSIYTSRYPELAGHRMVISEAVVRGKHYWRVSAAGFARTSASAMCGRVKSGGEGCFAYADGSPLPGAVDNGTRLAQRD